MTVPTAETNPKPSTEPTAELSAELSGKTNHAYERQTGLSLLAGIAIWFLHQNIMYMLTSMSCKWGWFPFNVAGLSGLHFVQIILTIVVAAMLVTVIYLPWRNWRRFQSEPPTENDHILHDTEKDRRPFMAFVIMIVNMFFLLFVVTSLVPVLALNACGQG